MLNIYFIIRSKKKIIFSRVCSINKIWNMTTTPKRGGRGRLDLMN